MNGQRVIAVALLVTSLFALGTLSASLGATVSSTPDDVIDVDTDSLPFVGDGASEIADSYRQAEDGESSAAAGAAEGGSESSSGGDPGAGASERAGGESPPADESGATDGDQAGGASAGQQGDSGQNDGGQGPGEGVGDSLWGLLAQYLGLLLALVALLCLLGLLRFLVRRRDRLLARLRALADRLGLLPDEPPGDVAVPDGEGEAATVVERAWGEMLQASPANPPPSDTPRECARQVIATGADPDAVGELTAMYERVRYGEGSITAEDASRALDRAREIVPGDGPTIDSSSNGPAAPEGTTRSLAAADAEEGRS